VQAKLKFNPLVAPTGVAFCNGCGLGSNVDGDLLVGTYLKRVIYALDLNADRDGIAGRSTLAHHKRASWPWRPPPTEPSTSAISGASTASPDRVADAAVRVRR
jgi:hypothetical protein